MFEQSILIDDAKNRSRTFFASMSAELFVVSLLILIPLAFTDRLPDFRWKNVIVGPPLRPIEQPVVRAQSANTSLRPVFARAARIFTDIVPSRNTEPPTTGFTQLEIPGALPSNDTVSSGSPIGDAIWKPPVAVKPRTTETQVSKPPAGPIRVTSTMQMAKIVKQVIPVYPPLARATHTSGVVHLIGVIAKDGTIKNLQVLSGHPLLTRAALDAVAQWVYKPTLLNGEPVEVMCPIDVNFTLSN